MGLNLEAELLRLKAKVRSTPSRTAHASDGLILNNRWQSTGKVLGSGKWGIVYLGQDLTGEEDFVAIKRTKDHISSGAENASDIRSAERVYTDEVRALRTLNHLTIARYIDGFTQAIDPMAPDLPYHFIVTELLRGRTAENQIEGKLGNSSQSLQVYTPDEAIRFVMMLGAGLAYAQRHGKIVHRDMHPGNVMLVPVRGPVALDLGLSKVLESSSYSQLKQSIVVDAREITRQGYIDPQVTAGFPSFSSDIYSLVRMQAAISQGAHVSGSLEPKDFKIPNGAVAELFARNASYNPHDRSPDATTFLEELVTASQTKTIVSGGLCTDGVFIPEKEGAIRDKIAHLEKYLRAARVTVENKYPRLDVSDEMQITAYTMDLLREEASNGNSVAQRMLNDERLQDIVEENRTTYWKSFFSRSARERFNTTLDEVTRIVSIDVDKEKFLTAKFTSDQVHFSMYTVIGPALLASATGLFYGAVVGAAVATGATVLSLIGMGFMNRSDSEAYSHAVSLEETLAKGRQLSYLMDAQNQSENESEFGEKTDVVQRQLDEGRSLKRIVQDFYALRGIPWDKIEHLDSRLALAKGFNNLGLEGSLVNYFTLTRSEKIIGAATGASVAYSFSQIPPGPKDSHSGMIAVGVVVGIFAVAGYIGLTHLNNHMRFKDAVKKLSNELEKTTEPTLPVSSYSVTARPYEPAMLPEMFD